MKTLLLLRHAKSNWSQEDQTDHDRSLNARGKRDAPRMGRLIKTQGLIPDLILSSTAKRARKTTQRVVDGGELNVPIEELRVFYLASPETYIEVLQQQDSTVDCILVVGHNPGIEELSHKLTGEAKAFPTAALAQVELDVEWGELSLDTPGNLRNIWYPRELASE
jgi:phosphohistidine phosphatase